MKHKFIITYEVNNDIPICPDHLHEEIKKAMYRVQAEAIDFKKLNGDHKLEIQPVGPWFEWPGITQNITLRSGSEVASLQALKLEATSIPTRSQGFKLQAKVHKLQDLTTRVQAHKPTIRGASNKDKGILWMFHVEANLVGWEPNSVTFCNL